MHQDPGGPEFNSQFISQRLRITFLLHMALYKFLYCIVLYFGLVFLYYCNCNCNHCNSQASSSNYCEYLHVLKYLLFIIIILKKKGVVQTCRLADV